MIWKTTITNNEIHRRKTIIRIQYLISLVNSSFLFLQGMDCHSLSLLAPVGTDKSSSHVSHLLEEADLPALIPLDSVKQIKFFLDERTHMINQVRSGYFPRDFSSNLSFVDHLNS